MQLSDKLKTGISKEVLESLSQIIETATKPLSVLATLALAEEFYPADERKALYARYAELLEADNTAFDVLSNAVPTDKMGWEERVKKFGEAVAQEHIAPQLEARVKRQETMAAVSNFRDEHGLIVQLIEHRSLFSKQ